MDKNIESTPNVDDPWANEPCFESESDLTEWRKRQDGSAMDSQEVLDQSINETEVVCVCGECEVISDAKGRRHGCCQTILYAWEEKMEEEEKRGPEGITCVTATSTNTPQAGPVGGQQWAL